MNPAALFKLKGYWEQFSANHPKLVPFIQASQSHAIQEGSIIDITITPAGGRPLEYNMKLTSDDIRIFREIANQKDSF